MRRNDGGQRSGVRSQGRVALIGGLALFLMAAPGFTQQAPPAQPPADDPGPADAAQAAPAPAAPAPPADQKAPPPAPAPATDNWLTGYLDLGYRWVLQYGNPTVYRSVINWPEGPRVLGWDFTVQDPNHRYFDIANFRGMGWGGDPYTTLYFDTHKKKLYDFRADYRNIAYFNAMPSFANPNAPNGFNEQSFDIRQRVLSLQLDLFPASRIIPYLAYDYNRNAGLGIQDWVIGATNNFAVPYTLQNRTDNYRGGVRFEFPRWHVTLEQGGTTFREDDISNFNGTNYGDNLTPVFGTQTILNNLRQVYGIRGNSVYSRALVTANPNNWVNLYGEFLYSQPKTNVNYTELSSGSFFDFATLLMYGGEFGLATGAASQPHVSGQWGFELFPGKRFRVMESVTLDRFHDASVGVFNQALFQSLVGNPAPIASSTTTLNPFQKVNYQLQQTDLFYDFTPRLTLRGGIKYVWGDTTVFGGVLSFTPFQNGNLRRLIGTGGATYRAGQKLIINADFEGSSSDTIYFRTDFNNYQKGKVRAKYQATGSLLLTANFMVLNNQNPAPTVRFDYVARTNSVGFFWTPAKFKRLTWMGDYTRATIRSNILYLNLPFFNTADSIYRDNAHVATTSINVALTHGAKLTAGGSLFISSGSRPTQYYQPLAQLLVPVYKHLSWNTVWQYYGYQEAFYLYEGFRANVLMTGIRLSR